MILSSSVNLAALVAIVMLNAGSAMAQLGARRPVSVNPLAADKRVVDAGERRFRQLCSSCHGTRGEGGQGEGHGPNLATSWEVRRLSNTQLAALIRNGVRGTSMPPFALPEEQLTEISAFVRSLNSPAMSVSVPGRPEAGRALFMGKGGCVRCHMVNGDGGYLGPDLSNAGATQRLDELRNAILKPKALAGEGFRPVRLHTPQGAVRGVIKHESNWSMQVVDENGKLHLLRDADIKKAERTGKSWMPDDLARRFTKEEIDDLVAFLSRLAVRREAEAETGSPKPAPAPPND